MKVVPVGIARSGLNEQARGAFKNAGWRVSTTAFGKQSLSKCAGDEDKLDLCVSIRDELGDELPVPGVVEAQALVGRQPHTVSVECCEGKGFKRSPMGVGHVERDVHVSAILMGGVARNGSAFFRGQLADGELGAGDSTRNAVGGALKKLDDFPGSEETAVASRFRQEAQVPRRAKFYRSAKTTAERKSE